MVHVLARLIIEPSARKNAAVRGEGPPNSTSSAKREIVDFHQIIKNLQTVNITSKYAQLTLLNIIVLL